MTLVKWNPAGSAFHWRENYLDDFLKSDRFFAPSRDIWYPAVDVTEDDDAYHVQVELPGLAKEDLKISFKDDVLLVSGEKKSEQNDEKNDEIRQAIRQRCVVHYGRAHGSECIGSG